MIITLIVELAAVISIVTASFLAYKKSKDGGRPLPYLLGFILCVSLAAFTSVKIIKTYMRRGVLAGAYSKTQMITQKWDETYTEFHRKSFLEAPEVKHAYWVSWTDHNIREKGDHRLSIPYDEWLKLKIGDSIQVIYNMGDTTPHYRDDIEDDVIFDHVLLVGELFGVVYMMRKILAVNRRLPDESGGVIHLFK